MKHLHYSEDTIAAISTAMGEGGIGIIRISGEEAVNVLKRVFKSRKNVTNFQSHRVYVGDIVNKKGVVLDEVMITVMRAPNTYTSEDIVEINCHGGMQVLNSVLAEVLNFSEVRLAEAGEFTRRAFLNGRLDLTQAEAVIDIIKAGSEAAFMCAAKQLKGNSGKVLKSFQESLIEFIAHLEASVDFGEDTADELSGNTTNIIVEKAVALKRKLEKIADEAENINFLKEGVKVVIAGAPNVGKSTFLNAVIGRERAIVTDIAGTTRDVLEESFKIEGIPLILTDTAGLRYTKDKIEEIGVNKAVDEIKSADMIFYVIDINNPREEDKDNIAKYLKDKNVYFVLNKIDLPHAFKAEQLLVKAARCIYISAKDKIGMAEINDVLRSFVVGKKNDIAKEEMIVSNLRQQKLLQTACEAVAKAIESLQNNMSEEFALFDFKNALDSIGEITGEVTSDDILDKIFSDFCVGK